MQLCHHMQTRVYSHALFSYWLGKAVSTSEPLKGSGGYSHRPRRKGLSMKKETRSISNKKEQRKKIVSHRSDPNLRRATRNHLSRIGKAGDRKALYLAHPVAQYIMTFSDFSNISRRQFLLNEYERNAEAIRGGLG